MKDTGAPDGKRLRRDAANNFTNCYRLNLYWSLNSSPAIFGRFPGISKINLDIRNAVSLEIRRRLWRFFLSPKAND